MNKNADRGNSITKTKKPVWKVKFGINSRMQSKDYDLNSKTKLWEIKVILN
jgi:hypothetical protein